MSSDRFPTYNVSTSLLHLAENSCFFYSLLAVFVLEVLGFCFGERCKGFCG